MKGDAQACEAQCADNFMKKCQPKHMDFANCFPGDGAWVCDDSLGMAPAMGLCAAEWAAVADCEANEAKPATCPDGMQLLGEFATWCGKVNVHMSPATGMWSKDDDCKSGCNDDDVNYCQKYWPGAEEVVEISVSPVDKPFFNAGCKDEFPHPGKKQFACCGSEMLP